MIFQDTIFRLATAVARGVVIPVYGRQLRQFERLLEQASQVQRAGLFARIERCRDTKFGRDHGFAAIRTLEDFRRQVPVARYDYFAPYIDAVGRGEFDALFPPSEKVLRFTITTGSTGKPKLNPVTTSWLKEYRQAWNLWGVKAMLDHPEKVGGKILQMIGTWNMGQTPGGIPISMVSALVARTQNPIVKPFYAVPHELADISDVTARYYTILRLSMPERIGLICLMNPGTLIKLVEVGNDNRELLIRDIFDGTLSTQFDVQPEIRRQLASRIRPNRPCAERLRQIVERTGRLYPKDYWPAPIIGCWIGGTAGYQARYLAEYFGDVPLRDLGLVSSEGRHTIPLHDGKPEGVLAITTHYYEFVPVGEIDSLQPTVLEGHELEIGRDYYLLMTTSSGYYRFNIGDIMRCHGFVGEAPVLEFLQKGDRCGDLEGEKVTEHQFVQAADKVAGSLGIKLTYITTVPCRDGRELPRYVAVVEHGDIPDCSVAHRFLESVDRELMSTNFLYSARRREGVLGPPRLLRIRTGQWNQFVQAQIDRRGTGEAHYKHPGLVQDQSWLNEFTPVDTISIS